MQKILSATQTKTLDQYTMQHEPISSINLMERASLAFVKAFSELYDYDSRITVWCGTGNNGGDGLAVARILSKFGYEASVIQVMIGNQLSKDNANNKDRLPQEIDYQILREYDALPIVDQESVAIDGLFGSGLSRPVEGYWAEVIAHINDKYKEIVTIDLPSGLYADYPAEGTIIQATYTISFQLPNFSFFFPEHAKYIGDWQIVDIGLSEQGIKEAKSKLYFLDDNGVTNLLKERGRFDHKGTFGHALMIAGSYGKMGAAVLASRACLKAGAGLLSVHTPKIGYDIMQISLPEAMVLVDRNDYIVSELPTDLDRYKVAGIGPGLGTAPLSVQVVEQLLKSAQHPLVVDADALNILARNEKLLYDLPKGSILTPHPKEFDRLFGSHDTFWDRWQMQRNQAIRYNCIIILKGGHTSITTPEGKTYFSTAGNPGMGTAGSGDVLTGILTGLLAQGYDTETAACLGVHLHGVAGDLAVEDGSMESLIAGQLVEYLGAAFHHLRAR
ncbi:MAG: NAD(P)H-hydrate dehydratase [Bacteroidota bacterium]